MAAHPNSPKKFVRDVIHGYIPISSVCLKIIDTPEFQRLRNIHQLGFVHFVYPSANHKRFEHCIGVSYLSGKVARSLLEGSDDKETIRESWIKCAEIAGLCHDIGHRPFSHFAEKIDPKFDHEEKSVELFEMLCKHELSGNDISDSEQDVIKAMIRPEKYKEIIEHHRGKEFMFQIVSNSENGMDVDKWDYLMRDGFYLGQHSSIVDYVRLLKHVKVLEVDGCRHICYPLKLKEHIEEFFRLRKWLHKHAYQHRVVTCINLMFFDAIKKKNLTITDQSTDAIYYELRAQHSELIGRIERRELYCSLGQIPCDRLFRGSSLKQTNENAKKIFLENFGGVDNIPDEKDLRVSSNKTSENPKASFYFYTKREPEKVITLSGKEVNPPGMFAESLFFFFSTRNDDYTKLQSEISTFVERNN